MTRINIEVDDALHKALRLKAIEEGINMSKALKKAIDLYVKEEQE